MKKRYDISLPKIYRDLLKEKRIEYNGKAHERLKTLRRKEKTTKIRSRRMENKKCEIPFDKSPNYFSSITVWDYPEGLGFAIEQLEASNKKYSIEKRNNKIRVWSKTFSTDWHYKGRSL